MMGPTVRIDATEALVKANLYCSYCHKELEIGSRLAWELQTGKMYHIHHCRFAAMKKTIQNEQLGYVAAMVRFRLDKPTAYNLVKGVLQDARP